MPVADITYKGTADYLSRKLRTVEKHVVAARKERDEARAEVARWKKNIIPFLAVHAGTYGRDHYGEGCMHYTHYDMLAEAGGRMDDFKRCGAPSPENNQAQRAPD